MPRGDGTGPSGKGLGTGKGRMGGTRPGAGPEGICTCSRCGATVQHKPGMPCYQEVCPQCGAQMVRG